MADQHDLVDLHGPARGERLDQRAEPPTVLGDVQAGVVADVYGREPEVGPEARAVGGAALGAGAQRPGALVLAQPVYKKGDPPRWLGKGGGDRACSSGTFRARTRTAISMRTSLARSSSRSPTTALIAAFAERPRGERSS